MEIDWGLLFDGLFLSLFAGIGLGEFIRWLYDRFHRDSALPVLAGYRCQSSIRLAERPSRWHRKVRYLLLFGLAAGLLAYAFWPRSIVIPERPDEGCVQDLAGMLNAAERQRLEDRSQAVAQTANHKILLVTVPSLDGHNIDDYTKALVKAWGLGDTHVEDGVVILVADKERMVRLDADDTLEQVLSEKTRNEILDRSVLPWFRGNDMYGGLWRGVRAVEGKLKGTKPVFEEPPASRKAAKTEEADWNWTQKSKTFALILLGFLFFVFIGSKMKVSNGRSSSQEGRDGSWNFTGSGSSGDSSSGDSSGGDGSW